MQFGYKSLPVEEFKKVTKNMLMNIKVTYIPHMAYHDKTGCNTSRLELVYSEVLMVTEVSRLQDKQYRFKVKILD